MDTTWYPLSTLVAEKKLVRVNRIVCWHFNGPYPDDGVRYEAAHLDCDPSNNHWWNLEWQTHAENSNHPITRARMSAAIKLAYQENPGLRHSRGNDIATRLTP